MLLGKKNIRVVEGGDGGAERFVDERGMWVEFFLYIYKYMHCITLDDMELLGLRAIDPEPERVSAARRRLNDGHGLQECAHVLSRSCAAEATQLA